MNGIERFWLWMCVVCMGAACFLVTLRQSKMQARQEQQAALLVEVLTRLEAGRPPVAVEWTESWPAIYKVTDSAGKIELGLVVGVQYGHASDGTVVWKAKE